MSGGKLTPRQKMINMMYLVLTALLALNVQKEVLNAFAIINDTLDKTIDTFNKKNAVVYDEFMKQAAQNPEKVGQWKRKADEVRKRAEQMAKYIHDQKVKLVIAVDNKDDMMEILDSTQTRVDAMKIDAKDNKDIPGEIMILKGDGALLRKEMVNYRDFMVGLIKPKDEDVKVSVLKTLETKDFFTPEEGTITWETHLFDELPFIAVVANLTQLQSAVKYAETEVISYLMKEVTGEDIPFNRVEAIVIPKSNYVIRGDSFAADIFLGAFDSLNAPSVYIGDYDSISETMKGAYDSLRVVNGKGKMRRAATSLGPQKFEGMIELHTKTGTRTYSFASQYEVAEANVVVSPTKMNVFYIGIPNPVDVSVSGYSQEKISATITVGSMRKVKDGWEVNIPKTQAKKCDIDVSVEMVPGKKQRMGKGKEFRIKNLPTPMSKFAKKSGTLSLSKSDLAANEYVVAEMENFDFDVKVLVTGFKMVFTVSGLLKTTESKTNRVTGEMSELMKKGKRGDRFYIEEIKTKMPDGTVRELPNITIKVM